MRNNSAGRYGSGPVSTRRIGCRESLSRRPRHLSDSVVVDPAFLLLPAAIPSSSSLGTEFSASDVGVVTRQRGRPPCGERFDGGGDGHAVEGLELVEGVLGAW
jgi:hypothetical protein